MHKRGKLIGFGLSFTWTRFGYGSYPYYIFCTLFQIFHNTRWFGYVHTKTKYFSISPTYFRDIKSKTLYESSTYMSVTSPVSTCVSWRWKVHCCQAPLPWWPKRWGGDHETLARLIPITLCNPNGGFTGTGIGWQLLKATNTCLVAIVLVL